MHWSNRRHRSSRWKADMRHVACDGSHRSKDHIGRSQIASYQRVLPTRSVEEGTHKRGAQLCDELALLSYCEGVLTWSAPKMTCMAPHTHETVAG